MQAVKRKQAILQDLRSKLTNETRLVKGESSSLKRCNNAGRKKENKQYCKVEQSELRMERRLLK